MGSPPMADWCPMAEFDPSKPALVHDKLNDKVIDWKPERYQRHYEAFATPFDPGVVEWNGLLLDGWKPLCPPRQGHAAAEEPGRPRRRRSGR